MSQLFKVEQGKGNADLGLWHALTAAMVVQSNCNTHMLPCMSSALPPGLDWWDPNLLTRQGCLLILRRAPGSLDETAAHQCQGHIHGTPHHQGSRSDRCHPKGVLQGEN
eukprot:1144578-Pelagomonas_calceolata.AAC.4